MVVVVVVVVVVVGILVIVVVVDALQTEANAPWPIFPINSYCEASVGHSVCCGSLLPELIFVSLPDVVYWVASFFKKLCSIEKEDATPSTTSVSRWYSNDLGLHNAEGSYSRFLDANSNIGNLR